MYVMCLNLFWYATTQTQTCTCRFDENNNNNNINIQCCVKMEIKFNVKTILCGCLCRYVCFTNKISSAYVEKKIVIKSKCVHDVVLEKQPIYVCML